MRLDLSKIRTPHEHFERTFPPEAFAAQEADDAEFRVASPVRLAFDIHKDKSTFRLVGSTHTTTPRSICGISRTRPTSATRNRRSKRTI
jgi:hypothetical protein